MDRSVIRKSPESWRTPPNLRDFEETREAFTWERARERLDGLPGDRGLNIAHEAVDRHAHGPHGDRVALRFVARDGSRSDLTFTELAARTGRFANVLAGLGVEAGDRVCALATRVPALYVAALGTLKHRAVFCPLFSTYGPGPVFTRMRRSGARVLVTTRSLFRRKVADGLEGLDRLEHVLLVDGADPGADDGFDGGGSAGPRIHDLGELLDVAPEGYEIPPTDPKEPALLHYTSGTTGEPKGAVHVHEAVVAHHATARLVLDLRPGDVFWCTADPAWVTGTSYGIVAPLAVGTTTIVDREEFDARRWYGILEDEEVSVWYTAPTAIRMLRRLGAELARQHRLPRLRHVASVGEPLQAASVRWGQEAFDLPIHDTWWQTETGAIMIANFPALDVKPGSMGRPVPGIEAAVVESSVEGDVRVLDVPETAGELALRPGWPSMFRGYLDDEERSRECFAGGWYLTGDRARRDEDGYFWYLGRVDDTIKTAGHLIGPFEVESALMLHPAVAEAGAVGLPDPVVGQTVAAFVILAPDREPDDALRREILAHARRILGAAVAPRTIEFRDSLPRTESGKIVRRALRDEELCRRSPPEAEDRGSDPGSDGERGGAGDGP